MQVLVELSPGHHPYPLLIQSVSECCLSEGRPPSSVQLLTSLEACLPGGSKSSPHDSEY